MCLNISILKSKKILAQRLEALPMQEDWCEKSSLWPKDQAPIAIIHKNKRKLRPAQFGFLRDWSKRPLYNTRIEDAATKRTWAYAYKQQRGLLMVDAFYEKYEGQRYEFSQRDKEPFVLAILWEAQKAKGYFSILTKPAIPLVAEVQSKGRMPVMLDHTSYLPWLKEASFYEEKQQRFECHLRRTCVE